MLTQRTPRDKDATTDAACYSDLKLDLVLVTVLVTLVAGRSADIGKSFCLSLDYYDNAVFITLQKAMIFAPIALRVTYQTVIYASSYLLPFLTS